MTEQREDILISRAIDGDATAAEWDELTALAEADPAVWRNLGVGLREHGAFARAINAGVAVADRIEMPEPAAATRPVSMIELRRPVRRPVLTRIGGWSGWAIAAVLTLAWVTGVLNIVHNRPGFRTGTPTAGNNNAQIVGASASDLLAAYLDKGRQEQSVIAEVPERILLETRPADTGHGYELVYLRQILERTVVPDLYKFHSRDEMGRPTLVRYEENTGPSM